MHIPANKLAEFVSAQTPERRERLVRQVKHGGTGHPIYYQCFHGPAKDFLVAGARDASGILRALDRLKVRTKTKWYEIDSRITASALKALIALGPQLYGLNAEFSPTGKAVALLKLSDVDVSVRPNLLVHATRNGKPLVGALRFYLAKESPAQLGVRGAELVATMQYLWLTQIATGARTPDPEHCVVVECMQQRLTKAPADPSRHIAVIERGCREFAEMWHRLDSEEAA
jgi:hypothetical protein